MKKNILFSLFAMAALLLATSCQNEDLFGGANVDTEVVSYTISTQELGTREGGSTAKYEGYKLYWGVYEHASNGLVYVDAISADKGDEKAKDIEHGQVQVDIQLAKQKTYTIVFWAQHASKPMCVVDWDDRKVSFIEALTANQKTYDAFWASDKGVTLNGASQKEVTLVRPFAQINIGAGDFNEFVAASGENTTAAIKKSAIEVKNVPLGMDIETGDIDAYDENSIMTFAASAILPSTEEFPVSDNQYIALGYVLADANQILVDIKLTYTDENGKEYSNEFTNVPVKRNHRTNIYGNLLTGNAGYDVDVDENYGGDNNVEVVEVATASDLQETINNMDEGDDLTIVLTDDIDLGSLFAAANNSGNTGSNAPALRSGTESQGENETKSLVLAAGRSLTLDLNGKTISQTKTQTAAYSMITNKGTLTIIDSDAEGKGTISYTDSGNGGEYVSNTISNHGILTVKSGTIVNASADEVGGPGYPYAIDSRVIGETEVVLNIEGGTIKSSYSPLRVGANNSSVNIVANITGGNFYGRIDFQQLTDGGKAELNISGGTFNQFGIKQHVLLVFGGSGENSDASGVKANITGGTFNAGFSFSTGNPIGSNFDKKFISGGEFTFDPSEYVADGYPVKAPETEGGYYTIGEFTPVAKVGDKEYGSLRAAIAAVEDGGTITMIANIEQKDGVIITDKNLTIDLNKKSFTVTEGATTNNRNFKINGSSNVTIKNGTMIADGEYSSGAYGTVRTEGSAKVLLQDLKLYNYRGNGLNVKALTGTYVSIKDTEFYSVYGGGIEAAGAEIVLDNVKVEQKGMYTAPYNSMAISVNGGGKVIVNSGTYSTECITAEEANNQGTSHGPWCAGVLNSGGTLIINGGTFYNDNFGDNSLATYARGLLLADTGADIQINGGTFVAVKAIIDVTNNLGDASRNPSATLTGGSFSADPRVSGLYASNLISVAENYKVVENNGVWTVVVDPAAKIGTTEYASLSEAFEVGGNITLLRDVKVTETLVLAEGKTATLDLNGKTLSAADMNVVKNNGGNLTIKNGTVTRSGDVVGYSVNNASGEIVVENATIKRGLYTSGSKMIANNANISHEQSSRHAIYAWNCEVTINSGNYHNDNAGNATLMASGSSVVTINGGTFSIADGTSSLGWTSSMIDQNSTAQVIVKGGLFNGGFRINSADTKLTIEGGEFNTNNNSAFTDYQGTKVVKGGKFTDAGAQDWAKKYIAEGYEMNANGEVVKK